MADSEISPALDEATLDQILEELKRRYDSFLLATSRRAKEKVENKDDIGIWYAGGFIAGMGLATAARAYLTKDFLENG